MYKGTRRQVGIGEALYVGDLGMLFCESCQFIGDNGALCRGWRRGGVGIIHLQFGDGVDLKGKSLRRSGLDKYNIQF